MRKYFRVRYENEFGIPELQEDRIDTHKEAMEVVKDCEVNWGLSAWLEEYEEQPYKEEKVYQYPNSIDGWEDIYQY